MTRKGQNIAIEQVLVFIAGVSLFLVFLGVFTAYQFGYTALAKQDLLESVSNQLYNELVKVSILGDTVLVVPILRDVGDEEYRIDLNNNGLNVSGLLTNEYVFTTVNGLVDQGLTLQGKAQSLRGKIIIKRTGNNIILEN